MAILKNILFISGVAYICSGILRGKATTLLLGIILLIASFLMKSKTQ